MVCGLQQQTDTTDWQAGMADNDRHILKNIPLVKQYTDSLQQEQTPKQKPTGCLSPDIVRKIERDILGMN